MLTRGFAAVGAAFSTMVLIVACGGGGSGPALPVLGGGGSEPAPPVLQSIGTIKVLSNRADLISGGDALVEWIPADDVDRTKAMVTVGSTDVTSSFATRSNGRYIGLITGLSNGENVLTVKADGWAPASTTITNHPNGGPVIYGPQVVPFACDSGATDAQCNRPVAFKLLYKSSDPAKTALLPYNSSAPPTDVATTTTDAGKTVPFIVRVETGVLNRDWYNIAVLFNPAQPWRPWDPQEGWNKKVVVTHGAGFGFSYSQLADVTGGNVLSTYPLSKGFAVMSTALNDNGHNGNLAVQAEAMIMLKERFIENYGEIRYTIGQGGSGGALAQQWIANAYPGIYNGLILSQSFPDSGTAAIEAEDCGLMRRYFTDSSQWAGGVSWSDAQRFAVQGSLDDTCGDWARSRGPTDDGFIRIFDPVHQGLFASPGLSPTVIGGCDAPTALIYHPVFNPTGVRCTAQDYVVGIMGRRSTDGFANRPYANVGVQYGFGALTAGTITAEQFVDLNAKVGSHSIDFAYQQFRTNADPMAVDAAYKSGWINSGHGMNQVAILDVRGRDTSSIHHLFRSWAMRARLDNAQGHHNNHVIWFNAGKTSNEQLDAMDSWLTAVEAGAQTETLAQRVVSKRPSGLVDLCGTLVGTTLSLSQCTGVSDASPRIIAGGPLADDVLDCKLRPLDRTTYPVALTDDQWARLQATFPTGICDYSQPGVAQQRTTTWQTYLNADGTVKYGGAPLPVAP